MTTEPKLLTEAEWERISAPLGLTSTIDQIASALRERGLIAPEPVDPLLVEAREIEARHCELAGFNARARQIRAGEYDEDGPVRCTLRGLRRGMELRPPITRERVERAVTLVGYTWSNRAIDRLHAALTDAKGGE